jgi:hypothetical protein
LTESHIFADSHSPSVFHVDLLGALFVIWGVLTCLIGGSTLALSISAAALIASGRARGGPLAAGLAAATFATLAVLALVWGIAHIVVGLQLRRRRTWSRLAGLALGSLDLLLLPYGTGLGAYALWTLLRDTAKALFEPVSSHPAHAG